VQNGRIWTVLIVIGIQPETTQTTAELCAFFLSSPSLSVTPPVDAVGQLGAA
jgi:hypothetical protein